MAHGQNAAHDPDASEASRDIADSVSRTHTYLISRSPHNWVPNAEVVVALDDATLTAAVTAIKQGPGRDLGLPGGVGTARSFVRLGLIDEYVLLIEPIALGAGQRLFGERTAAQEPPPYPNVQGRSAWTPDGDRLVRSADTGRAGDPTGEPDPEWHPEHDPEATVDQDTRPDGLRMSARRPAPGQGVAAGGPGSR